MKPTPSSLLVPLLVVAAACTQAQDAGSGASEAAATAGSRGSGLPAQFDVGQPFPALAFPRLEDGTPASVADYRGKKLILHVFASW